MSTARAIKAGRLPLRFWVVYLTVLGLLLLFFALIARFAQTRLAQKHLGPQYFQICEQNDQISYPCISVAEARLQMGRIIRVRKLAPEAAAEVNQLIETLAVPAAAHVVRMDHVNTLQLNLALDKLR